MQHADNILNLIEFIVFNTNNNYMYTHMITYKYMYIRDTVNVYIPVKKLLLRNQIGVDGKWKKFRN